jgi:hypothetical protein
MVDYEASIDKGVDIVETAYQNALVSLEDNAASETASTAFDKIIAFNYMDFFNDILNVLKIVGIGASILIFIGLVIVVYKANKFGKEHKAPEEGGIPEPASGGALTGRWAEIMEHMRSERETEWKLAVIEADNLIDDVLAKAGFPGDTMGERLTSMRHEQLLALSGVWKAHLLRNKIVHETDYSPRYQEIHEALKYYQAALEELGVM